MVADRHRHAAYHNKHLRRAFLVVLTSMTLNDLELQKYQVLVIFLRFLAVKE